MLNKLKPIRKEESSRFSRLQRQLTGKDKMSVEKRNLENLPLKHRIVELEEEIARLRLTIQFLQDLHLQDD